MAKIFEHFLPFIEAFNALVAELQANRLTAEEASRRKSDIRALAVEAMEGWRQGHPKLWGWDLVLWCLRHEVKKEGAPPDPWRYLLNLLYWEYPDGVLQYKKAWRKATEKGTGPDVDEWGKNPWEGLGP